MKISKVINNNVVSARDEQGREIVVMGCGIAFQKKAGDEVEQGKIDKIFSLSTGKLTGQLEELLEKIPYEHIQVANEIISYARISLNRKLNDSIYIALTDHINFAIQRKQQGIAFQNALKWEIRRFYNHEYQIGKEAIEIIHRELSVELSEDEAAFIALHIVNAELDTDTNQSMKMMNIIKDIENIVKYHFHIVMDEDSLVYERFVTHLKFFVQRAVCGQYYQTEDEEFCNLIRKQYCEAYECAGKIKAYMERQIQYELTEEEVIYLTVHIRRLTDVAKAGTCKTEK